MTREEMIEKALNFFNADKDSPNDVYMATRMADFAMSVMKEEKTTPKLPEWMLQEHYETSKHIYNENGLLPSVKYLFDLAKPHMGDKALIWAKMFAETNFKNSTK